jgi:8-oxo-dGTP diphosphatase
MVTAGDTRDAQPLGSRSVTPESIHETAAPQTLGETADLPGHRRPVCAVGAIILDKGEILIAKRAREPARGQWSLPGGRVEWGESLFEAVAREVREETGVDIDVEGLAGIAERIIPDDDGEVEYHFVILDFWGKPRSRALKAGDDAGEVRWVPVDQLSDMHLTTGLYEFLKDRGALEGRRPRTDR